MITKEQYETFYELRRNIAKRTEEIFKLLKGVSVSWNEGYESCRVDGDLEFRVGGHYRGEYDYIEYQRPLEYLFMTDEEIIKAEEDREREVKRVEELEKKEEQKRLREKELAELKRLKEKYE